MKASVCIGPNKTMVKDMPIPVIGDDEILLKVTVCGVCVSETMMWSSGAGGKGADHIMGHEAVGTIEAMGKNVRGFTIGDRVTGLMMHGLAEYTKINYRKIVKIPDKVSDIEALGEPLSCITSGAERTAVSLGDSVAVVGTGFMGLGTMQLLKLKGAAKVIAIDVREDVLETARKFGATETYFPNQVPEEYNVTEWAHIGRGINVTVDATGKQPGLELAGNMTAVHGVLSIVGWHQYGPRTINMELWNWKGITVINAHERRDEVHIDCMGKALRLIEQGKLNMKDMVTHEFGLYEVDAAYEAMKHKPQGFIKAYIRIS